MGWFSSTPEEKVMKAARKDNVEALRGLLAEHPEFLDKKLDWNKGSNDGYLLNYAAYYDSPAVIEFLVKQKGADADRNDGVGTGWTPLHHAENRKSYAATAKLLELGADPGKKNANGETTRKFIEKPEVQRKITPVARLRMVTKQIDREVEGIRKAAAAKKIAAEKRKAELAAQQREQERLEQEKQQRIAGEWKLTAPAEVTFTRELPDGSHSLTDIFNFQTRIWRAVVTGLKGQGTAQNVIFFDQVPDPGILQGAFEKLKELGGTADESAIPGGIAKKAIRPSSRP